MGNIDSNGPCLKGSAVQTSPLCYIFLHSSQKYYLLLDSFCLTSPVIYTIYWISDIPNKTSVQISKLSWRGKKKVFQPSLVGQGKHFCDPSQLATLTQMPFYLSS